MDYTIHGILQARILEWVAFPFSRASSQPRDWTGLLHCRQILYQLSHQGNPRIPERVAHPFSRGSSQPKKRTSVSCTAGGFFISWATLVLAIVNSAAMDIGIHVSLSILVSSGCMPSIGTAGSYDSSICSCLRYLHTVLHSGCTVCISTNSVRGFPFFHTHSSI